MAPSAATFRLEVLGAFSLKCQGRTIGGLAKKAQGLLAYLAVHRGRPIAREQLAALLWGHSGPEQARRSLRQCLMCVRAPLKAAAGDLLIADAAGVRLAQGVGVEIDVACFEALGRSTTLADLEAAQALYHDEFLAGLRITSKPFAEWISFERRRLATVMSDVLFRLAAAHATTGSSERAIAVARRLTAFDPLREDAHRLSMQLRAAAGHRSAALEEHAAYVQLLRRDLGVAPEPVTVELARAIREGHSLPVSATAQTAGSPGTSEPRLNRPTSALPDKVSIAVLPFTNLSGDPDQTYFADGTVEDITIALGHVPWLFVIASSSAFTYREHAADARQIGAELGVRYVLRGSVRKDGKRVRIVVQLIDASHGGQVWADCFEGELHDIFAIQDHVATQVAASIAPALRSLEIARAQRKRTENLTAYDLHLRALARFRTNYTGNQEALRYLARAMELDPSYSPAYGLSARCYHLQTVFGWALPSDSTVKEGFRLAYLGAEIGRDDSETLWMSGHTLAQVAGDYDYGVGLIDKSLSLNPNSASAWVSSCFVRSQLGYCDVALQHFARAQRLNPHDSMHHVQWHAAALAHFIAGHYEEAANAGGRALKERPTYPPPLRLMIAICGLRGQIEEGRAYIRRLLAVNPDATVVRLDALWQPSVKRSPSVFNLYLQGLRLAGMPEGV